MRYLYAKFTNYIGFLNGMGIDTVELDFTKCKSSIVLIKGINGSGKSTLMSALNLFPDSSAAYVPLKDSEKVLILLSGQDTYEIHILSPADTNGGRKTTKAFIMKNGVELNSNGNVSSYKDIIFSEFELDSNFLSLTNLSTQKTGLGSLTPAERKRFVANIIENLDIYNDMYKTLNKKSSLYKSNINNIHTKIQNIGSRENIETALTSLRSKEHSISTKIMELNNLIVAIQTKTSIDEEEARHIESLNIEYSSISEKIESLKSKIGLFINKTHIKESEIESIYEEHVEALKSYEIETESLRSKWISESENLKSISESINNIRAELEVQSGIIDLNVEEEYSVSKHKLDELIKELKSLGVEPNTDYIIPLLSIIDYFSTFCHDIDILYSDCTQDELNIVCFNYDPSLIDKLLKELDDCYNESKSIEEELVDLRSDLKIYSVLDSRPSNCKIDSCPFIKDALNISKQYPGESLVDKITALQQKQMDLSNNITNINDKIEYYRIISSKRIILDKIISDIEKNKDKLNLFKISLLTNLDKFLSAVSQCNPFNDFRDPQVYINIANTLKLYEDEYNSFEKISIRYNSNKNSIKLVNSNKSLLSKLEKEQEALSEQVIKTKAEYDKFNDLKITFSNKLIDEKEYINIHHEIEDLEIKRKSISDKLDEFNKKSSKALEALSTINGYRQEIDNLTKEDIPISDEISKLTGQLTLLDSYYSDYNFYKEKYDFVETLKKYCSPTNGGIQVLFMQLYMNKTLALSNQILSMLFNNEYKLLDFIINQNEFRIPFIGNGLPVDDISSGSSSQVCMMSMIINLVLLNQASTKFNIARLDEIDGPLDSFNRSNFVSVLYKLLPLLNIEQLFVISHSVELDSSNVDIIKLKTYNDYESSNTDNVIWDYENYI